MKKYMVTFETVVYVDAENEQDARDLAVEELSWNTDSQELVDVTEIKNAY